MFTTVLSTLIGAVLFAALIYPGWPVRGILLWALLKTNLFGIRHVNLPSSETVSVCLGVKGSVRWNLSLFNDMRVDCFIKTEEIVVGKDSCQQLPSGGEDAKVRIGNLEWRIATKWAGDYQVTFRLPEGCTLNHAMARASGCSYHVRIGLSWWQIPILRKTYIIQTFGTSIEEDNFSIREWP